MPEKQKDVAAKRYDGQRQSATLPSGMLASKRLDNITWCEETHSISFRNVIFQDDEAVEMDLKRIFESFEENLTAMRVSGFRQSRTNPRPDGQRREGPTLGFLL